jgi:deoxyribonuclease-4
MNIGAHVRGGGKLVPSLELGVEMGATSIQIFTQSPRMWKPSQYAPEVLAAYREAAAKNLTITDTFCHATYLINLASADLELYEKSVACLTHNLSVARGIGSSGLVLHVGSHLGALTTWSDRSPTPLSARSPRRIRPPTVWATVRF